jgi:hypothetical protein
LTAGPFLARRIYPVCNAQQCNNTRNCYSAKSAKVFAHGFFGAVVNRPDQVAARGNRRRRRRRRRKAERPLAGGRKRGGGGKL